LKGLVVIAAGLALAGCAREDEDPLPAGCDDSAFLARGLASAPASVPVAQCLTKDASAGEVQVAGAALLGAAERLGREGDANALGYLVGVLRRRSVETQGIHSEIVRRIEQEARPFRDRPGFERGLRAGRSSG
jgi:hypothetical protein